MTFEAENKALKPKKGKKREADKGRPFFFPQKGANKAMTIRAGSLKAAQAEYDKKTAAKEETNE